MGRRRVSDLHRMLVQFEVEDFDDLRRTSIERDVSINTLVRDIVRAHFDRPPSLTRTNRAYSGPAAPMVNGRPAKTPVVGPKKPIPPEEWKEEGASVVSVGEGKKEVKIRVPQAHIQKVWQYQRRYAGTSDVETATNLAGIVPLKPGVILELLARFTYDEPMVDKLLREVGEPLPAHATRSLKKKKTRR